MADDTTKMLRILINGQSKIHEDVNKLRSDMNNGFTSLENKLTKKIDNVDVKLTKRLDIIGLDLAKLSDDAPTIKEFDDLVSKVKKLQVKIALN